MHLVGGVGLPGDAAVGVGEDEVAVSAEGEGGVFADRVAAVGLPNPAEERLGAREAHAEGEGEGAGGGVVEGQLEWRAEHAQHAVAAIILHDERPELALVYELERLVRGDLGSRGGGGGEEEEEREEGHCGGA